MTSPGRTLVAGVDPEVVAAAVLACPAVAGLSGGPFGSAATYLPGRRVRGVVVRETGSGGLPDVAVHVVARFGTPMTEVAGQVRAAVSAAAPGSRTDVHVDDVALPGEEVPALPGEEVLALPGEEVPADDQVDGASPRAPRESDGGSPSAGHAELPGFVDSIVEDDDVRESQP